MNQENIALAKKYLEGVYGKSDTALVEQLCASDVKLHDPYQSNFTGGAQALRKLEEKFKTAFPNKTLKIEGIRSDADEVIANWTVQGTHTGQFNGHAPTNKNFKISGITIFCLNKGKITVITQQWDRLGMLEQLGLLEDAIAHSHSSARSITTVGM
jgi:steroid delta-isomerase-like uncharacterized protein